MSMGHCVAKTRQLPSREAEYGRCARTAREHCFIGKALLSDIRYEVGDVVVQPTALAHAEGK
jgi:hypothetical protein